MISVLRFLVVALILSTALLPSSVSAQVSEEIQLEIPEDGAAALVHIGQIVADYQEHRSALAAASAEDSLVLTLQIDAVITQFVEELPRLAALYPAAADDEENRELQNQIKTLYSSVNVSIWEIIQHKRDAIDQLRAQRMDTAATERGRLEFSIVQLTAQLNQLTNYAAEHIKAQAEMGLDLTEVKAKFRQLLTERADETVGRMMLSSERTSAYQQQLKLQAGDTEATLMLKMTGEILADNAASLDVLINLMDAEGMNTAENRALLVTTSQDIASGLLDTQVLATLALRAWQSTAGWFKANSVTYLMKLVIFSLIIFAGRLMARLVRKAVQTSLDRARVNISQLLKRTIVSATYNVVFSFAVMIALTQLGIDLGPLLAGFGVIGFILGFAMQDSLSNFASGLMILFYRPYDVGDLVDISGVFGKVEHMSLVSTSILTLDNQKLIVPNSKIWGDVIKNVTDQNVRRVDMVFGISYTDDIPKVEEILADILSEHEMILEKPEAMVKLHTLNDSSVDFVVRPWVKTADYWDVYWDVTREVKMRFDAEDVSIPFPQQDVHLHNVPQQLPKTPSEAAASVDRAHTTLEQVTEIPDAESEDSDSES